MKIVGYCITFLTGAPRVETRAYGEEIEDLFKPSLQAILSLTSIEEQRSQTTVSVKVCAMSLCINTSAELACIFSGSILGRRIRCPGLPICQGSRAFKSKIFKYPDQMVICTLPHVFESVVTNVSFSCRNNKAIADGAVSFYIDHCVVVRMPPQPME